MKKLLSSVMSLCLLLFIADAFLSLVDESLLLGLGMSPVSLPRALLSFLLFVLTVAVYLLLGASPAVPKRIFLPLVLFNPAAAAVLIPLAIYHFDRIMQIAWAISLVQLIAGLALLYLSQGSFRPRWPTITSEHLGPRLFSFGHLLVFLLLNVLLLLPGTVAYLGWCAARAVDHLSGGFVRLRWDGLAVQSRTYSGPGGKAIRFVPMVHVAEESFYEQIAESFPSNSIVLLEGVTDRNHLLHHKVSYERMANSLGLAEQHDAFSPVAGELRHADVDLSEFSPSTIAFLNMIFRLHAEGFTPEAVRGFIEKSQDPTLTQKLWDDLLTLRNDHLAKEIQAALPRTDTVVVPWGAAHMRGLDREVRAMGFRPVRSRSYDVLHFKRLWKKDHRRATAPGREPEPTAGTH